MSITRRSLLTLAALALPAGAQAFEFKWGGNSDAPGMQHRDEAGGFDFMRLELRNGDFFTARSGLIVTDAGAYYGSFAGRVRVRDENKIGIVKDIPLVGGLFTDRLRGRDFDPALQIGQVYRLDETLVVDLHLTRQTLDALAVRLLSPSDSPTPTLRFPGAGGAVVQSLVVANQTVSYHLPAGGFPPVRAGNPPAVLQALTQPGKAEPIGQAYRHAEGHLLTLVRPSILTGWS